MILSTAMMCLALNVYHESRGETLLGQYAVAHVTMNRAKQQHDKVCQVVLKPSQFSWTRGLTAKTKQGHVLKKKGNPEDMAAWELAKSIATNVLYRKASDVTGGATFYHANYVAPYWASGMKKVATIGTHIFYRNGDKSPVKQEVIQDETIRADSRLAPTQLAKFFDYVTKWSELAFGGFA